MVTDNDVGKITGGLERAAKKFGVWLGSVDSVEFYTAKYLLLNRAMSRDCVILLVGHRSLSLLSFAFYCAIVGHKFSWCPFWHDYKLEGKKGIRFGLYDLLFKMALSFSQNHFVVSNYEKISTNTKAPQYVIRLPGFIDSTPTGARSAWNFDRIIDILFVGRDVPHKQRSYARRVSDQLGVKLKEVIPGEITISDDDLLGLYRKSKIVFIPSRYESYSLVAVEGLLAGAIVVTLPNVMVGESLSQYQRFVRCTDDEVQVIQEISHQLENWVSPTDHEISFVTNYFADETCKEIFLACFNGLLNSNFKSR